MYSRPIGLQSRAGQEQERAKIDHGLPVFNIDKQRDLRDNKDVEMGYLTIIMATSEIYSKVGLKQYIDFLRGFPAELCFF